MTTPDSLNPAEVTMPRPRQPGEGSMTLQIWKNRLPDNPELWNPRARTRREAEFQTIRDRAINPLPESTTPEALEVLDAVNKGRETNLVSWKDAAYNVARMFNTEDDEAKNEAVKFINEYRDFLRPEFMRIGVDIDKVVPPEEEKSIKDRALGVVGSALDVLDVPSQAVLRGLGTVRQGLENALDPRGGAAYGRGGSGQAKAPEELDKDEDTKINFREVLGIDPEAGGRVAGALDTAAVIATDPTTYLTLGTGQAAKSAVRTAVAELGDDAARRMVTRGMKALSKEEQNVLKRAMLREAEETAVSTGAKTAGSALTETADDMFRKAAEQLDATIRVGPLPVVPRRAGNAIRQVASKPVIPTPAGRVGLVPELPRFARGIMGTVPARQSLVDIVQQSAPMNMLRRAFVPRAALADRVGQMAAGDVYDIGVLARKTHENLSRDAVRRLVGPMHELQKSLQLIGRKSYDDTLSIIQEALDEGFQPGMVDELAAMDIPQRAVKPLANMLRVIEDLRAEVDEYLAGYGLPGISAQQPKILTPDGIEAVLRNPAKAEEVFGITTTAGNMPKPRISGLAQPREIADLPIHWANARAIEAGLMREGTSMFESDLLKAIALRNDDAYHQVSKAALATRLSHMVDDAGEPLLYVGKSADKKKWQEAMHARSGYTQFQLESLPHLTMWGKKEIIPELNRMLAVTYNDESLTQWRKFMRGWSNLWASYATVPIVGGMGFHSRNAMGNVYLAFLAGMKNPLRFAEAGKLQSKFMEVRRIMTQEGLSFDDAVLRAKDVSKRDARLIAAAREDGILSTGFFADLDRDEELVRGMHKKLRTKVNPFSPENVVIRMGRSVGESIENNARLALYLDQLAKTGSRKQARETVRKFLFDYQDLTPFEVNVRDISRFYTFMRKNLGAHFYALGHNPGRVTAAAHIQEGLMGKDPEGSDMMPSWARDAGLGVGALGGLAGPGVMSGLDLPFGAAVETGTLPLAILSMAPGMRDHMPEWARVDGKAALAERILGLTAGPTMELFTTLMELHSGVDMFTGADISDETNLQTVKRLANSVFPVVGKVLGDDDSWRGDGFYNRLVTGLEEVDGLWNPEEQSTDNLKLLLLRDLFGIQAHSVDRYQKGLQYQGVMNIDAAITDLRRRGVDVPTLDSLRDAGLIPLQDPIIDILTNPDLDDEGRMKAMVKTLSKEQLEIFTPQLIELGINPEEIRKELEVPDELQDARADVRAAADLAALEWLFQRPLTDEERMELMLASPDNPLGVQDLGALGIEGQRQNQFAPKPEDEGPDVESFVQNAARFGFDLETIRAMRPALSDAERTARDAAAAGLSPSEAYNAILDKYISRKEQNLLLGEGSLETHTYNRVTPEDARKLRDSVQNQLNEASVLGDYIGMRLTPQQQLQFLVWNNMTKDELELLGFTEAPSTPSTRDGRNDEEKFQDAIAKMAAITGRAIMSWDDLEALRLSLEG